MNLNGGVAILEPDADDYLGHLWVTQADLMERPIRHYRRESTWELAQRITPAINADLATEGCPPVSTAEIYWEVLAIRREREARLTGP